MDNQQQTDTKINKKIRGYTPTGLDPETWDRLRGQVRQAVLATEPTSTHDAAKLISTLCSYLAWRTTNGLGVDDVVAALDETSIALYLANRRVTASAKTICNEQGRLRRMHRRNTGLPEPTGRPAKARGGPTPYSDDDLGKLVALDDPDVAAAVDLALATGAVAPAAYTLPGGYDAASWKRARGVARRAGVHLSSHRLRATWARYLSEQHVPVGDLVASGLAHTDLDAVVRAAAAPTLDQLYLAR